MRITVYSQHSAAKRFNRPLLTWLCSEEPHTHLIFVGLFAAYGLTKVPQIIQQICKCPCSISIIKDKIVVVKRVKVVIKSGTETGYLAVTYYSLKVYSRNVPNLCEFAKSKQVFPIFI